VKCPKCGKKILDDSNLCSYCGHIFLKSITSTLPSVAGILLIFGGIISFAGLFLLRVDLFGTTITSYENMIMVVWGISAFMAFPGGLFAIFKYNIGVSLIGCVFCVIAGIPIYVIGIIPGVVSIILIILARENFN